MTNTLAKLAFLGAGLVAGSGCTTDSTQWTREGRFIAKVGTRAVIGEGTRKAFNPQQPNQTTVHVNRGNPQTRTRAQGYWIDRDMLITKEDEVEAKAIYSVLSTVQQYGYTLKDVPTYVKLLGQLDTSKCPEKFRTMFYAFVQDCGVTGKLSDPLFGKMLNEAFKEGVKYEY